MQPRIALPNPQSPIPNPLSGARSATLMPKAWHGSLRRVRRGAWYAVAIVLVVMALVAGIVSQVLLPWAERHPERIRSEEHTSELQSLMRISYAVFCLKKKQRL